MAATKYFVAGSTFESALNGDQKVFFFFLFLDAGAELWRRGSGGLLAPTRPSRQLF